MLFFKLGKLNFKFFSITDSYPTASKRTESGALLASILLLSVHVCVSTIVIHSIDPSWLLTLSPHFQFGSNKVNPSWRL